MLARCHEGACGTVLARCREMDDFVLAREKATSLLFRIDSQNVSVARNSFLSSR